MFIKGLIIAGALSIVLLAIGFHFMMKEFGKTLEQIR